MINYLIVSAGAAIGGAARYWLSNFVYNFLPQNFPYGTLTVNFIGSIILGIVVYFFDSKELISPGFRLFITIGFCGGFTTFSTFSIETINLFRDSQILLALLNIFSSIILCLAAVYLVSINSKI